MNTFSHHNVGFNMNTLPHHNIGFNMNTLHNVGFTQYKHIPYHDNVGSTS